MRALIATDGSDFSLAAARRAQRLLDDDVTLVLVAVVPEAGDPNDDATGFAAPILDDDEVEQLHQAGVVGGHGALAATARALGPEPYEQHVVEGTPGPEICRLAEEIGASVIVVGSHNKGFLAKAFLGSVSSYVVRHAHCPVLVVHHTDDD